MWVRGLKLICISQSYEHAMSHPMWVRGLKPLLLVMQACLIRRTLCGCVD